MSYGFVKGLYSAFSLPLCPSTKSRLAVVSGHLARSMFRPGDSMDVHYVLDHVFPLSFCFNHSFFLSFFLSFFFFFHSSFLLVPYAVGGMFRHIQLNGTVLCVWVSVYLCSFYSASSSYIVHCGARQHTMQSIAPQMLHKFNPIFPRCGSIWCSIMIIFTHTCEMSPGSTRTCP